MLLVLAVKVEEQVVGRHVVGVVRGLFCLQPVDEIDVIGTELVETRLELQGVAEYEAVHCSHAGENDVRPVLDTVFPFVDEEVVEGRALEFVSCGCSVGNDWELQSFHFDCAAACIEAKNLWLWQVGRKCKVFGSEMEDFRLDS